MNMTSGKGWGKLVACGDKSKAVTHFDRTENKDVSDEGLRKGSDFTLRLGRTVIGRVLMNSEGTARAQQQVADLAIDVPSISAKHCIFQVSESKKDSSEYVVYITDVSRHGVEVNGKKIKKEEKTQLSAGDRVKIPFDLEYTFELVPDGDKPIQSVHGSSAAKKTPGGRKRVSPTGVRAAKGASGPGNEVDGSAHKRAKEPPQLARQASTGAPAKALHFDAGAGTDPSAMMLEEGKRLEGANIELRKQVEALEKDLGDAKEQVDLQQRQLAEAKSEFEAAKAEALEAAASAAADELRAFKEQLSAAEERAKTAEAAAARDAAAAAAAAAAREEADAAIARIQSARDDAESRAESAEQAANEARAAQAAAEANVRAAAVEARADLEAENAALREKLECERSAAAAATTAEREAREHAESLEDDKTQLEADLGEVTAKLAEARAAAAHSEQAAVAARASVQPLRDEAAAERAARAKAEHATNQMEERLAVGRMAYMEAQRALAVVGDRLGYRGAVSGDNAANPDDDGDNATDNATGEDNAAVPSSYQGDGVAEYNAAAAAATLPAPDQDGGLSCGRSVQARSEVEYGTEDGNDTVMGEEEEEEAAAMEDDGEEDAGRLAEHDMYGGCTQAVDFDVRDSHQEDDNVEEEEEEDAEVVDGTPGGAPRERVRETVAATAAMGFNVLGVSVDATSTFASNPEEVAEDEPESNLPEVEVGAEATDAGGAFYDVAGAVAQAEVEEAEEPAAPEGSIAAGAVPSEAVEDAVDEDVVLETEVHAAAAAEADAEADEVEAEVAAPLPAFSADTHATEEAAASGEATLPLVMASVPTAMVAPFAAPGASPSPGRVSAGATQHTFATQDAAAVLGGDDLGADLPPPPPSRRGSLSGGLSARPSSAGAGVDARNVMDDLLAAAAHGGAVPAAAAAAAQGKENSPAPDMRQSPSCGGGSGGGYAVAESEAVVSQDEGAVPITFL